MSTEIEVKTDTEVLPKETKEGQPSEAFREQKKAPRKPKSFNFTVLRICLDGMMTALYIGLSFLKIRIGNVQISFAAIPLCFTTLTSGLPDGLVVALLGSFIEQLTSAYGLTPTTPLWMAPHLLRVLILWLFDVVSRKKGKPLYDRPVLYFVGMIVSAIFLTASNTLALYLDSLIIGYAVEIVLVETIIRFATSMATAVVTAIVLLPVIKALKKNGALDKIKSSPLHLSKRKVKS